ncbi:tyrosine-type recombinase/integrase [Sapientia aquatica]|uniref:Integrase n=1 Tax=Sapientia aquatica TaxID=1549640 RepID=A0A4V3AV70_9BURK|nr:tyrosine-type recombinase/integrase [Sapientia aquatica]TDK68526.1 integrase [Sapientia aquatica]
MSLKKKTFADEEIPIFDSAVIYKRGEYWQMRMWLEKEGKYARFSLRTRSQSTAEDKAKGYFHRLMADQLAGKKYFSNTTKCGVEEYLKQRYKDVEAGLIVKGRYGTIKTHLDHWLNFIGRDTKLKELDRTDCENYFYERTKTKKRISVSQTTIANEQSTINAMMLWLFKRQETLIEAFDFKKLPRIDKGDDTKRRAMFTDEELARIKAILEEKIKTYKRKKKLEQSDLTEILVAYYFLISIATGLRRSEQLQLCWNDIDTVSKGVAGEGEIEAIGMIKFTIRAETSKVRKTRKFLIQEWEYTFGLDYLTHNLYKKAVEEKRAPVDYGKWLLFSLDGVTPLTPRTIGLHFDKLLKAADIKDTDTRDLVPYSFRHNFITKMVNAGFNPTQVGEVCGTSTTQIEQTYYHTTERKMIENALPNYYFKDDLLVPK